MGIIDHLQLIQHERKESKNSLEKWEESIIFENLFNLRNSLGKMFVAKVSHGNIWKKTERVVHFENDLFYN